MKTRGMDERGIDPKNIRDLLRNEK